ncbi:MAG: hypothetical protein WCO26_24805, partial [Deltaproteobacteria bacterium]
TLSRNGGSTYPETLATSVPVSAGSFNWTVSGPTSTTCRVKVTSLSIPSIFDSSNSNFTIKEVQIKKVAVIFAKWSDFAGNGPVTETPTDFNGATTFADAIIRAPTDLQLINDYYMENSYGSVQFAFTLSPSSGDWLNTGFTKQHYLAWLTTLNPVNNFNESWFLKDAIAKAKSTASLMPDQYDYIVVLHPDNTKQTTLNLTDPESCYFSDSPKRIIASYRDDLETVDRSIEKDPHSFSTLAHELGHALGAQDRYDSSGQGNGNLGAYDLMAYNYVRNHMSVYTKAKLGWLNTQDLPVQNREILVPWLPKASFGETFPTFSVTTMYYLDGRRTIGTPSIQYDKKDNIAGQTDFDFQVDGVAIYRKSASDRVDFLPPPPNLLTFFNPRQPNYPTLSSLSPTTSIPKARGQGSVQLTYLGDAPDGQGFRIQMTEIAPQDRLFAFAGEMTSTATEESGSQVLTDIKPDLDLHAWDNLGRHVGINYSTGQFEIQIPGAEASGDICGGEEWISVPKGAQVTFKLSSHDVEAFLQAYPQLVEDSGIYPSPVLLTETSSTGTATIAVQTTVSLIPGGEAPITQTATLTGRVYRDVNGNGSFDPGEGIVGATVTATPFATVTSTDGEYTLPLSSGTYAIAVAEHSYLPGSFNNI